MSFEGLWVSLQNGVRIIKFNRPQKKNAFSSQMYEAVTAILNNDAQDDSVVITILTGEGDYYSSGNDLSTMDIQNMDEAWKRIYSFVNAFIQYPKLLIAVVNGPAIGIAVTTLALCDVVYASDKATFSTPFVKLGFCAEGCSSYTFARIMGKTTASEMLLLGRKLNAEEAHRVNFVSRVVEHRKLNEFIQSLRVYGQLPVSSIKASKGLMNGKLRNILCDANRSEVETLKECVQSEQFSRTLLEFVSKKKSKL